MRLHIDTFSTPKRGSAPGENEDTTWLAPDNTISGDWTGRRLRIGEAGGLARPQEGAMQGIWYVVGFGIAGVSFVFLVIALSWLISHRTRGSRGKGLPYESGIDTYGDTHGRFGVSYYLYALLFVAFDIEVIFIFLWALVIRDPIPGILTTMFLFVGILLLGLAYAWRKGVLTWR